MPPLTGLRYAEKPFTVENYLHVFFFSLGQYEAFHCRVLGGCWVGKVPISFSFLTWMYWFFYWS